MKISKKLYIGEDVQSFKWVLWKLRRNKKIKNIYCICVPHKKKYFLEILKGTTIGDQHSDNVLVGLATTKENAINLIVQMFEEIYIPNPNIESMKAHFITKL